MLAIAATAISERSVRMRRAAITIRLADVASQTNAPATNAGACAKPATDAEAPMLATKM